MDQFMSKKISHLKNVSFTMNKFFVCEKNYDNFTYIYSTFMNQWPQA